MTFLYTMYGVVVYIPSTWELNHTSMTQMIYISLCGYDIHPQRAEEGWIWNSTNSLLI